MEEGFEEPQSRILLVDNEIFELHNYQREDELESRATKIANYVFGPRAIYFDIRQRVSSRANRVNVTDGVLLELRKDESRLWLVEYELSSHDLYSHIQPQIMGFIRSLRNPQTLREVQLALYEEIKADAEKGNRLREFLGSDADLFFFLDRVLHEKCGVVIVIDEINPQLSEICEDLAWYAKVEVIEFKTYQKDNKEIYHFNPFLAEEAVSPEERAELPEYRKTWEARLQWINPETRTLAFELIKRLESELPEISHQPKYRWYYFYKGKVPRHQSFFAVLLLAKRSISIRIRVDPSKFEDRLGVTKRYKGWFFKAGERGFSIKSPEKIDYALELVKQAYDSVQQ